jgi:hypothetical protein
MLVAVSNTPSYGGGLRICPDAKIDDGRLDVVVIKPVSKLELVKVYPRLFTGTTSAIPLTSGSGPTGCRWRRPVWWRTPTVSGSGRCR